MALDHKILPHYTYNDWIHWEGRWELLEGHPIAMSPGPVPEHQRVAAEIRTELTLALRQTGCKQCRAYDPIDFKVSEDTILEPDVLIVCGEIKKAYLDFPPVLVVEVLSPSTALRDRHTKYKLYEQQGVPYYLIVDVKNKTIEIYGLEINLYTLQPTNAPYTFHLTPDCSIKPDLSSVFL